MSTISHNEQTFFYEVLEKDNKKIVVVSLMVPQTKTIKREEIRYDEVEESNGKDQDGREVYIKKKVPKTVVIEEEILSTEPHKIGQFPIYGKLLKKHLQSHVQNFILDKNIQKEIDALIQSK